MGAKTKGESRSETQLDMRRELGRLAICLFTIAACSSPSRGGSVKPCPYGNTTGHFEVEVVGDWQVLVNPHQGGRGKDSDNRTREGTIRLHRVIDPCPDDCFICPDAVLPATADVNITLTLAGFPSSFDGELWASDGLESQPPDPLAQVKADYSGPGSQDIEFAQQQLWKGGGWDNPDTFNEIDSATVTLSIGVPRGYSLILNSFAFVPVDDADAWSEALATLSIQATVPPGQDFTVPCCIPLPPAAGMGAVAFGAIGTITCLRKRRAGMGLFGSRSARP